jgi:cytochrome d ubiquinol oxidase subunit I
MVIFGGLLLLILALMLFAVYRKAEWLKLPLINWIGILSIPVVWVCSQSGWIVAEVGRQPWVIQDLLPTTAAISDIPVSSVQLTFWIFAAVFTLLLAAEISIMLKYISRTSKTDIQQLS